MAKKTTRSTRIKIPKTVARTILPAILRDCRSNKELKSVFDSNDLSVCLDTISRKKHLFSKANAASLMAAIDIFSSSSIVKNILRTATLLELSLLSEILKVAKPELSIEFHESPLVEYVHTGLPRPVVWYRGSYSKENEDGKSTFLLRSSGGRENSLRATASDLSDYSLTLDRLGTYRNSKHRLQLIDEELLSEIIFGFEKIVEALVSAYERADGNGKAFSRIERAMRDLELPQKRNQLIAKLVNWRIGLDEPSEPQSVKQFKQMKFSARQIENRLNHKKNKRLR